MELSGQFHAPAALSRGKSPRYPLDRRLGGPQSRSGRGGEEENTPLNINLTRVLSLVILYSKGNYFFSTSKENKCF
jgi:hypothetical protein